jgi:hypothetical protein
MGPLVGMLVCAAVGLGTIASTATSASAYSLSVGRFECSYGQVIAYPPAMTSLYNDTENVKWAPVIQQYTTSGWVNYIVPGTYSGVSTPYGSSNWVNPLGNSVGKLVKDVPHGAYYRVISWVKWANLNNQDLTPWYGWYVSSYVNSSSTYCYL